MIYKAVERNYQDVQHGQIRENVEQPYTDFHDALSRHYYENRDKKETEKEPFVYNDKEYGVLTKALFDQLHAQNESDRHTAVMTDIVAVDNYIKAKGEKPSYLTEKQCQAVAERIKPEELSDIKARLSAIDKPEAVV